MYNRINKYRVRFTCLLVEICFVLGVINCNRHGSDFVINMSTDTTIATGWLGADTTYRALYRGTEFIYKSIDTLFGAFVIADSGLVAYDSLYSNMLFRSVIDSVARMDMGRLVSAEDSLAFLVNAYNVTVIFAIKQHGILRPDQNNFSFFSEYNVTVAGRVLTLDDLEKHDPELISRFDDPRIHFVLVCAARGCPPLLPHSYYPHILYQQFDAQAQRFINSNTLNPILQGSATIVRSLFNWYRSDFKGYQRDKSTSNILSDNGLGNTPGFIVSCSAAGYSAWLLCIPLLPGR